MNRRGVGYLFLALFIMLVTPSFAVAQAGSWDTKTPIPTKRYQFVSEVVNDSIYVIGGYNGTYYSRNEVYDPVSDTWTTKAAMTQPREGAASGMVNGKIYVIGGGTISVNRSVEEYDVATNSWTSKADLAMNLEQTASATVGGKIYVIGGSDRSVILNTVWEYDPADDSWTAKQVMPTARNYITASVVDGIIYVFGGGASDHTTPLTTVEAYDPALDTWSAKAPLPATRSAALSVVVGGKIYLIGGSVSSSPFSNSVLQYDPATDEWTNCDGGCADLPTGRMFLGGSTVGGKIYAISGQVPGGNYKMTDVVEEYTPPGWDSLDVGLVAYYPFNGNANDESGNGNHGTVNGATLAADRFGNANSAYSFDGVDDRISFTDMDPWTDFSVAVWFKTDQTRLMRIVEKDEGANLDYWSITVNTDGRIYTGHKQGSNLPTYLYTTDIVSDNKWHLVVTVREGNEYRLFYDNVLDASATYSVFVFNNNAPFIAGYTSDISDHYFDGPIDDIRIYNRALSATEVQALYHEGGWDPDTSLVAYYPFNGNANDESGNGNHGTVNGATLATDRFGNANSAYSFDGVDDYIVTAANSILNSHEQGSFSLWFNLSEMNQSQTVMNYNASSASYGALVYVMDNIIQFHYSVPGFQTTAQFHGSTVIATNSWYHVTIASNGSELTKIYLDGELEPSTFDNTGTTADGTEWMADLNMGTGAVISIGAFFHNNNSELRTTGLIDDIRIYDRALSAAEVQALYLEGQVDTPPAAPTNLNATASDQQISLQWSANTEPDLSHYIVYQGSESGFDTTGASVVQVDKPDTIAIITELTNGVIYYFVVAAVDSSGNQSAISNEASAIPILSIAGLVAYYPFNGNANDASGHGNHGDTTGHAPALAAGRFGNPGSAYSFDGSAAYIAIPHSDSFNFGAGAYTLEAWVNVSPSTTGGHVFHKRGDTDQGTTGRGWYTMFGEEGRIGFSTYNDPSLTVDQGYSGIVSEQFIVDSEWHHFTFLKNGDNLYVYIDGSLDNWGAISTPGSPDNNGVLDIGRPDGGGGRFIGLIDDIRIYNRALNATEIDSLYHAGGWPPILGPLITDLPSSVSVLVNNPVNITATVSDTDGVNEVSLSYARGNLADFSEVEMAHQGGDSYFGTIPGGQVTLAGVSYFISADDLLSHTSLSDTLSITVRYTSGAITSDISGTAFPDGFPYEKWRLISLPGDIDNKTVLGTIREELGNPPSDSTWMLYSYVGPGSNDFQQATSFALGKSYFLKQVDSKQALHFTLGAGESYDLTGLSITLQSRKWHFVSAPYPFPVTVAANQTTFIGPYAYGAYGGGGEEGWSENQVQYTFKPWGGYIIYNNTDQVQTLDIRPPGLVKAILPKSNEDPAAGWLLHLTATGQRYFDAGNVIGRLEGASDGLDDRDHPEPPTTGGYISVTIDRPDWAGLRTSDIRSLEASDGVWDLALDTKGETGPITLSYRLKGEPPPAIALVDLAAKEVYRLSDGERPGPVTEYNEHFAYRLKVVAGSAAYVSGTTGEILAALPADFALAQNYPNPFNPVTTLEYTLPRPARISLRIYDLLGREVVSLVDGWQDMGPQAVVWAGQDRRGVPAATGIYFAVLRSASATRTIKMLLLK